MDMNNEKDILLGFLSLFKTPDSDGKIGAILITDSNGVPQEFRCSHPVKPTAIQKPLYGDTLEPYIGVQLCGIPLLNSIQLKPTLIIVDKEFLLEVREDSPHPVVFIRRAGEAIELKTSEEKERVRVDSPNGRFQPIIIISHTDFGEDKEKAQEILNDIFNHLDPYEPFERMKKAVEVLGKQDNRFQ